MAERFKPLTGYSGAQLLIAATPGRVPFVRKFAATPQHNARLRLQMERQAYFGSLDDRPFLVPAVLNEGMSGDRFYFDMEFVEAVHGAYFLAVDTVPMIRKFCANCRESIKYLSQGDSILAEPDARLDLLASKLERLIAGAAGLTPEAGDRILTALAELIRQGALRLRRTSLYHGDFTLENMLVNRDGEIVLLDFLDSPLPHYWQDISKLHIDLESHWYSRRHRRISEWVVNYLREEIIALAARLDPLYAEFHHLLVATNLLRVLPYARNDPDRDFLVFAIEHHASRIAPQHRALRSAPVAV